MHGEKHVKFNVFGITENGQMDWSAGHSIYTTETSRKFLLATLTESDVDCHRRSIGYAMGDTPAAVNLTDSVAPKWSPVLSQWMHGVWVCSNPTFTIVSDRLKSDTRPAESHILSSLHESGQGVYNTEAPLFDDEHIREFVETFDARIRGDGKKRAFMTRDRCRQR